jgi:AraC-like DNA-binding protein
LAQRVVDIDAILAPRSGIAELRERMCEAEDLGVALARLEAWLLQQYARSKCSPHAATQIGGTLLRGDSGPSVESLARECGVSARRLHELFLREVGLPAKRLSRILRFRRALEQLARSPHADLRVVALECGYYDQSHMYRDFRALAGMTPLEYVSHRDGVHEEPDVVAG